MIYLVSYKTSYTTYYHLYYNSDDNSIYECRTFHGNAKNVYFTNTLYIYDVSSHSLYDNFISSVYIKTKTTQLPKIKNMYSFDTSYSKKHILEMVEKAILENIE